MRLPVLSLVFALFACGPQNTMISGTGGGAGGGTGGSGGGAPSNSVADGTLGTWDILTPLPVARANHCAVTVGDFILVAGGNYRPAGAADFLTLDDVRSAKVLPSEPAQVAQHVLGGAAVGHQGHDIRWNEDGPRRATLTSQRRRRGA